MTRLALVFGSAVLAAACSTVTPSLQPSATATAATPTSGPTAGPTPTPVLPGVGLCPTNAPLTPFNFVESNAVCFAGRDFEIRGWLDGPPAIGFAPPGIAPGWIYNPTDDLSTLWDAQPIGPDKTCEVDGRGCAWMFVHVDPASGPVFEPRPRWVIATGHVEDAIAETCRYVYPDDWTGLRLDDQSAVALCRSQFVLVSIRDAP